MTKLHAMLDIETVGTESDAIVLSIGLVFFDPHQARRPIQTQRYWTPIDIDDQIRRGRQMTGGTFRWWLEQGDDARKEHFLPNSELDAPEVILGDALEEIANLCREFKVQGVWGNGSDFDNAILQSAAKQYGVGPMWPYWANRCFRTFTNLFDKDRLWRPENEHKHNALEDARNQVKWMHQIIQHNPYADGVLK